jgi:outer membrane protein assembly factor BamE (lipoprotein component of BamABCDE complex)
MTKINPRFAARTILVASMLLATSAVFSATGFTLMQSQEAKVTVGMSRADVLSALGRPAHNLKYINEPGRSWTYGVLGTAVPRNTVFDIDFTADGKVLQTAERVEPFLK